MNAPHMARTAYAPATGSVSSPRATEYNTFARVTRAMKAADGPAATAAALHDNRRLWTLLAAGVADAENALPADLRGRLFYLAEFTNQHTSRILNGDASTDVLVEINTAVMRGLRQQPAGAPG